MPSNRKMIRKKQVLDMSCHWCQSEQISEEFHTVYWELPDGTGTITIEQTPTTICKECGMMYQEENTVEEIENQLLLINTKKLSKVVTYEILMKTERILKRNYFDFR